MGGDKQALVSEYVTCNRAKLYKTAYMYLGEREAALDALHDAIVRALQAASSLRQPEFIGTWFYRILINSCMTELRKRPRFIEPELPLEESMTGEEPDRAEIMDLYRGLAKLDARERGVLVFRYFEDMKISEIAKVTGANESTVKSRIKAALDKLRQQIGEEA